MFDKVRVREEGQGLVEYALILVLVAIVVIAILLIVGPAVSQVFCQVTNKLQAGSCSIGGGDITGASADYDPGAGMGATPSVTLTISVNPDVTAVQVSGDISKGNIACSGGSCSDVISNGSIPSTGSATVTVKSGGTGTASVSW